jgi:hypothetical protein
VVTYMPILKGREGEFKAIGRLDSSAARHLLPIFEVVPASIDSTADAFAFTNQVRRSLPADLAIAVDVRYLDDPAEGLRRPIRDIAEDLAAWRIPVLPVFRLEDSAQRLGDIGYAAETHGGDAVLRLGGGLRDPDDAEAESRIGEVLGQAGLAVERCHLLIDFGEVRNERDVTRVESTARKCVTWAQRYPWRSITIAAGAMPESLAHVPINRPTPIERWDTHVWQRVRDVGVGYADYAIAHPRIGGLRWRPTPNLRYTADDVWWIYRWHQVKGERPAMYDLCRVLVTTDHWPAEGRHFSWGDSQIAVRAGGSGGPGNPANWRAWATSHHIAHVVHRLNPA